ncbi:MAG TPA: DUF3108 domain-containing protein [Longimicrobiales bacterium]|nr:DUF3108 domain-containing protein [Longimicrobiales bacterium]
MTKTLMVLAMLASAAGAAAQSNSELAVGPTVPVAPVPFGPGELATYRVTYGVLGTVGRGVVEVAGIDTVRGHPAYHLVFRLKGGIPFAKVDDVQESWLDVGQLYSHRFKQDIDEVNYERLRTLDFFPAEKVWRWKERETEGPLATELPLDDVAFMYFARTLPLEVGETYTFERYYKDEGNPVTVKVLRRQTVKVPAGTFRTLVLKPIIRTKGLFAEGGEAELYFSDDDRRMLVLMTTKVAKIGTLKLHLEKYQAGTPLGTTAFSAHPGT